MGLQLFAIQPAIIDISQGSQIYERSSLLSVRVLVFNDTSTLVGHFVSSPREKKKTLEQKN